MDLIPTFKNVKEASRTLVSVDESTINRLLLKIAEEAEKQTPFILSENKKDLDHMDPADPKFDRLKLTEERIKGIAGDIRNVASLPSPLGRVLDEAVRPNGLKIQKVSFPMGVIGIVYEARPNVTFDVFSLCLKAGNACILKGGSDAQFSNEAIVKIIKEVIASSGLNTEILALLPPDRETVKDLLEAREYVDIIIPRGSQGLIDFVVQNSKIPVIETGAGIVHTYFDEFGDVEKGKSIVFNAKTRRVSVCNALDCLVVHKKRLDDLPKLTEKLAEKNVLIYADEEATKMLSGKYPEALLKPADENSFGTEFLSYTISVKTVNGFEEALEHIYKYSSKHSEAIISENEKRINEFMQRVDAAAVYANTSTAFTDGAQFGLGAEIGISTQKLHARGPMALHELTTYKWLVRGEGQIRNE
jgi:glutamate-5-semialdehyde dehydrogenase